MELVTESLAAAVPEKASAFGRERPMPDLERAKLALKKDKVKWANFGQGALLQVIILLEEACDKWISKPTAPGHACRYAASTTWPVAKAAI